LWRAVRTEIALPLVLARVLAAVVQIEQASPGADLRGLDHCYQIVAECERLDDPGMPVQSRESFATWMSGFGDPRHAWLATDDAGQPAGCYVLTLPTRENLTMATCLLAVVPARRRGGIGTALLEHCAGQARLADRVRLAGEALDGSAGAVFAAAAGARAGMALVFRQLAIDGGLVARLAGLRAAADRHAAGYTLLSWPGATPEAYMGDSARLSAAMADGPTDAGVEPQVWDADRIRAFEQTLLDSGRHIYCVAARHDKTGCLAAITQVTIDLANPGWAQQGITAVLPGHRGHRLGLLAKAEMLELLIKRAPDVRRIVVRNASTNEHMVAINEQLGYQVSSVRRDWELDLAGAFPDRQP
jgi:GNAT superfamily N-acetyltransferase